MIYMDDEHATLAQKTLIYPIIERIISQWSPKKLLQISNYHCKSNPSTTTIIETKREMPYSPAERKVP